MGFGYSKLYKGTNFNYNVQEVKKIVSLLEVGLQSVDDDDQTTRSLLCQIVNFA